jgi:Fe-Mn family superoxide dismutase
MAFKLPALPYGTSDLEPFYDKATLEFHHGKHHAAYVDNLNKALAEYPRLQERSIEELLGDLDAVPQAVRQKVINHGGGHANHSLFWTSMGPKKGGEPGARVAMALAEAFGSVEDFRKKFSQSAGELFGSGWTFLAQNLDGTLEILNLPNQESPISRRMKPLLPLDLWEHAYYLKWQNRRPEWIQNFWNLVDWQQVDARMQEEPSWLMAPAG